MRPTDPDAALDLERHTLLRPCVVESPSAGMGKNEFWRRAGKALLFAELEEQAPLDRFPLLVSADLEALSRDAGFHSGLWERRAERARRFFSGGTTCTPSTYQITVS